MTIYICNLASIDAASVLSSLWSMLRLGERGDVGPPPVVEETVCDVCEDMTLDNSGAGGGFHGYSEVSSRLMRLIGTSSSSAV